jgi:hypothetical protein
MPVQPPSKVSDAIHLSSGSSTLSQISISSTYRHHHSDLIPSPSKPQPILLHDAQHAPRTRGSLGLMIVGLAGRKGLSVASGLLANQRNLTWKGPRGEMKRASFQCCQTQLPSMMSSYFLASANLAAIGGWVCAFEISHFG